MDNKVGGIEMQGEMLEKQITQENESVLKEGYSQRNLAQEQA